MYNNRTLLKLHVVIEKDFGGKKEGTSLLIFYESFSVITSSKRVCEILTAACWYVEI